jgi:hypothetical protein
MKRSLNLRAGSGDVKTKYPSALTTSVNKGSKLLNVGKKVFGRTPIGKAVGLAIAAGTGANIVMNMVKINLKVLRKILKE